MNDAKPDFILACTLKQLQANGSLLVRGSHRPVLVVFDRGRVFSLDNRCPHMGFPLDRGSIEDGVLTCHWHYARFDLASGCAFDLWADDMPTCPVGLRHEEVWLRPDFRHPDPIDHWHHRLQAAGRGEPSWHGHRELSLRLLDEQPTAVVEALNEAIRTGARPVDVGRALACAAALRLARFGMSNEHSDWQSAHHTFTYATPCTRCSNASAPRAAIR